MDHQQVPPIKKTNRLSTIEKAVGESDVIAECHRVEWDLLNGPDWITDRRPPPLAQWNPEHCGDIGMEIHADGTWWHQGTLIKRQELVRLFSGILRKEDDGNYYLVTPVEKIIVKVELHPLLIVDAEFLADHSPETLILTLNTGGQIPLDLRHQLAFEPKVANVAYVVLDHGLSAIFSRAAWYRLADKLDETGAIYSAGERFQFG